MSIDATERPHRISDEVGEALLAMEPGAAVLSALQMLLDRDANLLELDANERSLTHRFAMYLQERLPDWEVDCEYNRDGHNPKRVDLPQLHPQDDDTDAKTVFPDVIAHRRGRQENYLVIEFKKMKYGFDDGVDQRKLRAYKEQLHYPFALFVAIGVEARCGAIHIEWIR